MKNEMQTENIARNRVLKLLSDEEVAKVSTAEAATHLLDGEEYLDLEHLELGVQRAAKPTVGMGGVLPRRTVHKDTWNKILSNLSASGGHEASSDSAGERTKTIFPL